MGCFWKPAFKAIGNFFRQNWGAIVQIAAAAICSAVGGPGLGSACGVIATTIITGITSGDLGKALRAGLISAVTAIAFYGIGELTGSLGLEGVLDPDLGGHGPLGFMSEAHLFNVAGHAAVGCGSAVASGGKCGPGALSAAAGSFATPLAQRAGFYGGLVITSTAGGLASVAGGGKFGNGAVTAAFGYLFNAEAGRAVGRAIGGLIGFALIATQEAPWMGHLGYAWGAEIGGRLGSDLEDEIRRTGLYSHLNDPEDVGIGKRFTGAQRDAIIEENMRRNGGVLRSDQSGQKLELGGNGPDSVQIDHIWPRSLGGTNSYGNAQVLSGRENRIKSNWLWLN